MHRLTRSFFARPTVSVAQALLGKRLVRELDGERLSGVVVESEAYCNGQTADLACHASRNGGQPTRRTRPMFGKPGIAYVYFTYGIHWLLNVVTESDGQAGAVLIRAVEPVEGELQMAARRPGRPRVQWTNGPAKLTMALAIDGSDNGRDLCAPAAPIWFEDGAAPAAIASGPRVGLGKTPEPWLSLPWRYWIAGNPFVSRSRG